MVGDRTWLLVVYNGQPHNNMFGCRPMLVVVYNEQPHNPMVGFRPWVVVVYSGKHHNPKVWCRPWLVVVYNGQSHNLRVECRSWLVVVYTQLFQNSFFLITDIVTYRLNQPRSQIIWIAKQCGKVRDGVTITIIFQQTRDEHKTSYP